MAIRTREEILASLNERFNGDTSDEVLGLIEDVTDTLSDYERRSGEDWKKKYEDNDAQWRQRYKDRFMGKEVDDNDIGGSEEPPKKLTYDDLFTVKE